MNRKTNSMTDQQYFELLCQRIYDASCNIAHTYDEYLSLIGSEIHLEQRV